MSGFPIKPGTDLAFLLSLINVMVKEELYDKKFVAEKTVGFEQLEDEIINYPPEWAEKVCEIPAKTITRIAREIGSGQTEGSPPPGISRRLRLPVSEQLSDREGPGHCQQPPGKYQPGGRHLLSEIGSTGRTSAQASCSRTSQDRQSGRNGGAGKISPGKLRRWDRPCHSGTGPSGRIESRLCLPQQSPSDQSESETGHRRL